MNRTPDSLEGLTRPEEDALRRVLVAAVVAADRPEARTSVEQFIETAPIRALPGVAALHRLSGTVLRGLDGVGGVPEETRRSLDEHRGQSALHHLLVVGALSEVARAFDDRSFAWVVMKGPVVAELLYADAGDRGYADLDLLVARHDFPRAMATLEELGYVSAIKNWALAERMLAGQVTLTGPIIQIDLHWALHYSDEDRRPFGFFPEAMIERARRVEAAGLRIPTFDSADTLVNLAFHAARSGGHRLLWLKDIERSIAVDRPDLDEVVRRALANRCGPPVGIVLDRTASILDADVPDEVIRALLPLSLRVVNRATERFVPPIRLHERDSITRWLTRSVRSSTASTVVETPRRAVHKLIRASRPPQPNETDDPSEKASFLHAVSTSTSA
jgi:hypothetical protein